MDKVLRTCDVVRHMQALKQATGGSQMSPQGILVALRLRQFGQEEMHAGDFVLGHAGS